MVRACIRGPLQPAGSERVVKHNVSDREVPREERPNAVARGFGFEFCFPPSSKGIAIVIDVDVVIVILVIIVAIIIVAIIIRSITAVVGGVIHCCTYGAVSSGSCVGGM